jgi:thiol-disulfide isomerase/thioredoxin
MSDYIKYLKYKNKYCSLKNSLHLNQLNHSNQSGGGNTGINIILFKAEWCGHCTKLKPTWDKIQDKYNKKFNFITFDADKNRNEFDKYKVDAFPTIIIEDGVHKKEYQGDRDFGSFDSFFNNLVPVQK